MSIEIGTVEALFRHPVKSMRGERLDAAALGWHGLDGDRRLAFRRVDDRGGFPWLTASRLPALLLYEPVRSGAAAGGLPTHVRTAGGEVLELFGDALAAEVGARHGAPVAMLHLDRGIFDEASVSVIAGATVDEIGRLAAQPPDVRRFRPNVLVRTHRALPFEEDDWVGGVLTFGRGSDAAAVAVTNRDERCAMVGFDPDTARNDPAVLRAIVRVRDNRAGVYATVVRRGPLAVGQPVLLTPAVAPRAARRARAHRP